MLKVLGIAAAIVTAAYAGYNADIVIDKAGPIIAKTYHELTYVSPKAALEKCYKRAVAKMDFSASCGAEMDLVIETHGMEDALIYGNKLVMQTFVDTIARAR